MRAKLLADQLEKAGFPVESHQEGTIELDGFVLGNGFGVQVGSFGHYYRVTANHPERGHWTGGFHDNTGARFMWDIERAVRHAHDPIEIPGLKWADKSSMT